MTRFKLVLGDDGSYELTPVPDEPAPATGPTPLAKAAVAAVVLALLALYGCGAHTGNATPNTPSTTASAKR